MQTEMMWLAGAGAQPRRIEDWSVLLKLHKRRGESSQILVVGVSTEVAAEAAAGEHARRLSERAPEVDIISYHSTSRISRLALVELRRPDSVPLGITVGTSAARVWGVWIAPTHPGAAEATLSEQLADAGYLASAIFLPLISTPSPSVDTVINSARTELARIAEAEADDAIQAAWEQVMSLAENHSPLDGPPTQHDVADVFKAVRELQRRLRDSANEYRNVGDADGAEMFRDRLSELGIATQALGVSVSLTDARRERQEAARQDEHSARLTTMALILAFPAIYLTALPFVVSPESLRTVTERIALASLGIVISAFLGWALSTFVSRHGKVE
ncbi:hypothetical protein [Tessaracoccus sp. Z1128]